MATVAILTMSDGRPFVAKDLDDYCRGRERIIQTALETAGHRVVVAAEPITSNSLAVHEARRLAAEHPDLTVFHYPVWAFPHFTLLAAAVTTSALALFSAIDPVQPGMVGLLAAGGALDQLGRRHSRIVGEAHEPTVAAQLATEVRAAYAASALRGATFGRIGGRPMGMYTAASSTEQWMDQFGIDVEEIDQWEIVRRAETADAARVRAGREWLETHSAGVHYDGMKLTPELLERQISAYYAVRDLIDEWHLDFAGIKGQPELTNNFATMDVAEAFLNDPYDWEGPKQPFVCSTESDMDGALTMQIMKLISGLPVLFADVRHYNGEHQVWDLANSGQHATWYAARSDDPLENLARVNFYPEVFFFPAGGASVHHIAAPGEATFARLSRLDHAYRMQVVRGRFRDLGVAVHEQLAKESTFEWPHAFTELDVDTDEFLRVFGANHIHAIPGDWVAELRSVCDKLGVAFTGLGALNDD